MINPLLDPDCEMTEKGGVSTLKSRRFDDIYYAGEDGLAETRLVFLGGTHIPERLAGCKHFTIAETGFGAGLNFLAVMAEIKAMGDAAPYLHYISTEIAPLDGAVIDAALAPWRELVELRSALVRDLPPRWPGRHRRHFLGGRVTLDLLYGDSQAMLGACSFKADAWFLDGFAPVRNPRMWEPHLFDLIAARSAPGASLASFTAAGDVRRGLEAAGFRVTRHKGFAGKRHRISGIFAGGDRMPPPLSPPPSPPSLPLSPQSQPLSPRRHHGRIVILGAGIAGASVAASLMRYGITPLVIGAGEAPADGASGNIAAVQSPRLTASDTAAGRFALTAWGYARYRAKSLGVSLADMTAHLAHDTREATRQQKIASLGWPQEVFTMGDEAAIAAASGLATGHGGMIFTQGGTVDPAAFVKACLKGAELRLNTRAMRIDTAHGIDASHGIDPAHDRIAIHHEHGVIEADTLILAAGPGMLELLPPFLGEDPFLDMRPFQVTAGHVSHLEPEAFDLISGLSFGGYMARARDGRIALGARFEHCDLSVSEVPSGPLSSPPPLPSLGEAQHQANIDLLPPALRASLKGRAGSLDLKGRAEMLDGRTSLRLASPDRQPLAGRLQGDHLQGGRPQGGRLQGGYPQEGRLQGGVYVLTGLGARGMVTAPILGEHIAALILGLPSPLDDDMAQVIDPNRFKMRAGLKMRARRHGGFGVRD